MIITPCVGNGYFEAEQKKMGSMAKVIHRVEGWAVCHECFQHRKGDALIGVFEKDA